MIPKFRAWDKINKEMITSSIYGIRFDGRVFHNVGNIMGLPEYQHNLILMQSTDLKDKNGVEIFEGDVVHKSGAYIIWDNHLLCWCFVHTSDKNNGIHPTPLYKNPKHLLFEVIGNIHENPELIK